MCVLSVHSPGLTFTRADTNTHIQRSIYPSNGEIEHYIKACAGYKPLHRNDGSKAELKGLADECDSFVTAHIRGLRLLLYRACGRDRRQKIDSDLLPRTYARAIVGIGMREAFFA